MYDIFVFISIVFAIQNPQNSQDSQDYDNNFVIQYTTSN